MGEVADTCELMRSLLERHQELNSTVELLAREMSHLGGKSPAKKAAVEEEELKYAWTPLDL